MASTPLRRFLAPIATIALLATASLPAQQRAIRKAPDDIAARFDVTAGTLQDLWIPPQLPAGEFRIAVNLDGDTCVIVLRPHDVRAANFRLLVADATGIHQLPTPPSITWRGAILDRPDSFVAASIDGGSMNAILRTGRDQPLWAIQPVAASRVATNPTGWSEHIVFEDRNNTPSTHQCGVTRVHPRQNVHPRQVAAPQLRGSSNNGIAEIALEADSNYLNALSGSTTAVQNDLTTVINGVDAIYFADAQVSYQITSILVRTSATNPYSTNDPNGLLIQFRSEWVANQTGVQRDVAHLFTGRNLSGSIIGIAYLGVMCSQGSGFGLSQSRYSRNMTNRVALTAHELGHNWGANHCNSSNDCRIMCSGLGGCSGVRTSFSPSSRQVIAAAAQSSTCLSSNAPLTLTAINPAVGVASGNTRIRLTGTGLLNATRLDVGGTQYVWPGGFLVVNDNTAEFASPRASSLNSEPVTATSSAGPSNALSLGFQLHNPPVMYGPLAALPNYPMNFEMFGPDNSYWFMFASFAGTTAPVQGVDILQSRVQLGLGTTDAIGSGTFTAIPPAGIFLGLPIYTQGVFVNNSTLSVLGSTGVIRTYIYG